ncbi:MAG: ATP-binding protein [Pseudomonadota bacterium]
MSYENFSREDLIEEIERLKSQQKPGDSSSPGPEDAPAHSEGRTFFLQTVIDAIPGPIFYKDAYGVYLGCNSAFEKMIGRGRDEIIGRTVREITSASHASQYQAMDAALLKSRGTQVYDFVARQADGALRDYTFFKAALTDSRGEPVGIVGVMLDITDKKKAEASLQKARNELEARVERRTRELALANLELRKEITERARIEAALVQSSEKLKIFAYSIVHDLKSPTVAIHGLAKNMKRRYQHLLDEKGITYLNQILQASELVAVLVEKINIFIAAKDAPLKIESVSLPGVLEIIRDEFSTRLSLRQIAWKEPEGLIELRADRVALLRVFRNFVDNALKYGGDKLSRIHVSHREDDCFHILLVSDDGAGLRTEDSERIMGLFQRVDSSLAIPGSGLGLAIVREIAERHGGSTWVEAGPDRDTTFFISISKGI